MHDIEGPKTSRHLLIAEIYPAKRGSCLDGSTKQHRESEMGEFGITTNRAEGVQRIWDSIR